MRRLITRKALTATPRETPRLFATNFRNDQHIKHKEIPLLFDNRYSKFDIKLHINDQEFQGQFDSGCSIS
jgi:hypothetical protein